MDSDMGPEIEAAIDIGSNTVLLLVAEVDKPNIRTLYEEQHVPRLGKGVDKNRNLDPDSMHRVIKVLQKYKSTVAEKFPNVTDIQTVATSAVRDANNRKAFLNRIHRETGLDVSVLTGKQEAEYTYLGAKSVLRGGSRFVAVIDIGGGSTEIAVGESREMIDHYSFDVGSVRFTERYLKSRPPTKKQLLNCREAIVQEFESRPFELPDETELIGVAGTVTSMATIALGLTDYQPEKLNGQQLPREQITTCIDAFSELKPEQLLEHHPEILKGRADVILGGLLILEEFMNFYGFKKLYVSTCGIRHGALLMD